MTQHKRKTSKAAIDGSLQHRFLTIVISVNEKSTGRTFLATEKEAIAAAERQIARAALERQARLVCVIARIAKIVEPTSPSIRTRLPRQSDNGRSEFALGMGPYGRMNWVSANDERTAHLAELGQMVSTPSSIFNSDYAKVKAMLERQTGATLAEIATVVSKKNKHEHTASAYLTHKFRERGWTITRTKDPRRGNVYTLGSKKAKRVRKTKARPKKK